MALGSRKLTSRCNARPTAGKYNSGKEGITYAGSGFVMGVVLKGKGHFCLGCFLLILSDLLLLLDPSKNRGER